MPTYEYECSGCGNAFEAFQKMSDDPLTKCEACGGVLKKRVFPVGIVFKGSGFYVNDYARKGKEGASEPTAKSAESAAPSPGGASSETPAAQPSASETKPEAKPAPAKAPAGKIENGA